MAEDSSAEKTEQATPRRLEQARKKGQVARSKEFATAAVLIASAVGMYVFGTNLAVALLDVMTEMFTLKRVQAFDDSAFGLAWASVLKRLTWPLMGFIVLVFIAGFIGSVALGGITFSKDAAMPKLSKMSPLKGFKRMFGVQAVVELVKAIAKFLVIAVLAWLLLTHYFPQILRLGETQFPDNVLGALDILLWMFILLCSSLLLIAAIDAPYQIWNHAKQLKMTLQEVKDEFKDTEGKPEVKGRIRQQQREVAQRRMMQDVPEADVIVTNPTHFSVALKYDTAKAGAPILLAKGVDETAMKIREIAREHKVPLVASPALARAIYHTTELQQQIPQGLFTAVAQVLAYVFQLKQFQQRRAQRPQSLPKEFEIPEELRH